MKEGGQRADGKVEDSKENIHDILAQSDEAGEHMDVTFCMGTVMKILLNTQDERCQCRRWCKAFHVYMCADVCMHMHVCLCVEVKS